MNFAVILQEIEGGNPPYKRKGELKGCLTKHYKRHLDSSWFHTKLFDFLDNRSLFLL